MMNYFNAAPSHAVQIEHEMRQQQQQQQQQIQPQQHQQQPIPIDLVSDILFENKENLKF